MTGKDAGGGDVGAEKQADSGLASPVQKDASMDLDAIPETVSVASREVQITTAIIDLYLETGKAQDAPAIAARLGFSETKLRRAMNELHGCPRGVHAYQEHRESHSRNYRSMTTGSHKVWVYEPTLATLRAIVLSLRAGIQV